MMVPYTVHMCDIQQIIYDLENFIQEATNI